VPVCRGVVHVISVDTRVHGTLARSTLARVVSDRKILDIIVKTRWCTRQSSVKSFQAESSGSAGCLGLWHDHPI
jgi:hypothetical protein